MSPCRTEINSVPGFVTIVSSSGAAPAPPPAGFFFDQPLWSSTADRDGDLTAGGTWTGHADVAGDIPEGGWQQRESSMIT